MQLSKIISIFVFFAFFLLVYGGYLKLKSMENQRDKARYQRDMALNQVNDLTDRIKIQNKAVEDWRNQSAIFAQKYEEAKKEAHKVYADNSKRSLEIMNANVSNDCNQAMKWGVKKALEIITE